MQTFPVPAAGRQAAAQRIAAFIESALPGKPLRVTVELQKRKRSDPQNAALWGVAYKALKDATGNDPQDLHEFFLGEHFGWEVYEVMGQKRRRPIRRSSKLSTLEFAEFYAFIQQRAAECGFYVPDPNEDMT
jgi:hypothetical protein